MGKKVYQDRHGNCSECQAPFRTTVKEQIFLETLGYSYPKKCVPCRRKGKKEKMTGERLGSSIKSMFEAGEFAKLFEPREEGESPAAVIPEIKPTKTAEDISSRTPEENRLHLKKFFSLVHISEDQPHASLEDIKILMTRAGDMRWPDDREQCRKQNCNLPEHSHPYFKSAEAKAMIKFLYTVESSKELRKPQIDYLYEEFGKVLSGRAYLCREGETVYIENPPGENEEEVKKKVLEYQK